METGRSLQDVEATLVHPERQLPLLLRVHHRQGAARNHSPRKHPGPGGARSEQAALLRTLLGRQRGHQGLQDRLRGKSCRR